MRLKVWTLCMTSLFVTSSHGATMQWQHSSDPERITIEVSENGRVSFFKEGPFFGQKYTSCAWTIGGLDPLHLPACFGGVSVSPPSNSQELAAATRKDAVHSHLPSAAIFYYKQDHSQKDRFHCCTSTSEWLAFDHRTINFNHHDGAILVPGLAFSGEGDLGENPTSTPLPPAWTLILLVMLFVASWKAFTHDRL